MAQRSTLHLLLAATASLARLHDTGCPKAVSIYAMQKTGSTFLGLFSRSVALRQHMCKVLQNSKEFVCETVTYIDCPRNALHRKTVHLERAFSPPPRLLGRADLSARQSWDCGEPELVGPKGRAQWRCKSDAVAPLPGSAKRRCDDQLRHEMFAAANGWLRSTTTTAKYRYNFSLSSLLSSSGFVRGPLRQLYTETDAHAVPWFRGYHNVVIVHTRHPVEMMVSAYFCIADPKVCPVRARFLGSSFVPKNDSVASLDDFVRRGVLQQGSTPYQIMHRSRKITQFMASFRRAGGLAVMDGAGAQDDCATPSLFHSKYELMVGNFSTWAQQLLGTLMRGAPVAKQRGMHAALVDRHKSSFVPDGKHRHGMFTGANIAKLRQSTVKELVRHKELHAVLDGLSYDWFGFDAGRRTNHPDD